MYSDFERDLKCDLKRDLRDTSTVTLSVTLKDTSTVTLPSNSYTRALTLHRKYTREETLYRKSTREVTLHRKYTTLHWNYTRCRGYSTCHKFEHQKRQDNRFFIKTNILMKTAVLTLVTKLSANSVRTTFFSPKKISLMWKIPLSQNWVPIDCLRVRTTPFFTRIFL